MRWMTHNTMERLLLVALAMTPVLMSVPVGASLQATSGQIATSPTGVANLTPNGASGSAGQQGVVLDRVVAVVNDDVILESDVDEERRFEEIQPYRRVTGDNTRERVLGRLIDRALILQQAALEPEDTISDKDLEEQLMTLRKDIPDCKLQYHCETEDGWKKFLSAHGFTEEEFRERWRLRMELLKFIEVRFRNGIKISDAEIKEFYEKRMLPEYAKRNVTAPQLDTIRKRIEEVELQQQVGALLVDWLKSLRAQGSVKIMTPGEVTP
jgi:peptidyl-prolyl cis-trans isomerase SurA